ncbi:MAG: GIY-YIG nuclease family protein [Planctomycetota bacterium]|nr:GIY-YIG nuclease family protein [Planctomycetota bacterium]
MNADPGTYALVLRSDAAARIRVGRLGELDARRGYYVYVGSAFGPGGLAGRLAHHQRPPTRPHWHIDYLRTHAPLIEIWFTNDAHPREHKWADLIGSARGATIPLPGFGSSDCTCRSHLFHFAQRPSVSAFRRRVRGTRGDRRLGDDAAIRHLSAVSCWPAGRVDVG